MGRERAPCIEYRGAFAREIREVVVADIGGVVRGSFVDADDVLPRASSSAAIIAAVVLFPLPGSPSTMIRRVCISCTLMMSWYSDGYVVCTDIHEYTLI